MGKTMQKAKRYNLKKFLGELTSLVGPANVVYKRNSITAIVPIRKECGEPRYKLKIKIDSYGYCDVYIIEPKIKKFNGENPPHVYPSTSKWNEANQEYDELKLCLYLPGNNEYSRYDKLIESVISWSIKWTEFYELWLLTGEWFGGGEHPSTKEDEKDTKERNNA